jgi:hypothetical protein
MTARKLVLRLSDDENEDTLPHVVARTAPMGVPREVVLETPPRPARAQEVRPNKRPRDESSDSDESTVDPGPKRARRSSSLESDPVPFAIAPDSRGPVEVAVTPVPVDAPRPEDNPCWGCAHYRPGQHEHACLGYHGLQDDMWALELAERAAAAAAAISAPPAPRPREIRASHCWGCVHERPSQVEHACLGYGGTQSPHEDIPSSASSSQEVLSQAF